MPRRKSDVHMLNCPVTADEHAVVDEMRRRGAVDSDANLIRIALWSLANEWGDIGVPNGCFDCRSHHANPQNLRARARVTKAPKAPRAKQPPSADHPWRRKLFA